MASDQGHRITLELADDHFLLTRRSDDDTPKEMLLTSADIIALHRQLEQSLRHILTPTPNQPGQKLKVAVASVKIFQVNYDLLHTSVFLRVEDFLGGDLTYAMTLTRRANWQPRWNVGQRWWSRSEGCRLSKRGSGAFRLDGAHRRFPVQE